MANFELFWPKVLESEGGFVNHKNDRGGATNLGITLENWKINGYDKDGDGDIDVDDLKIVTVDDFKNILKKMYWNRWQANNIKNQSIAEILVDWCYNSGTWGVKIPQRLLGLKTDGVVGPVTLKAINDMDPEVLFDRIWAERYRFYANIVKNDPSQEVFFKGWVNRLKKITFND